MDPSPLPSQDKELLWQSGEKKIIRSVGPRSLHTDLSWSLVVAITVVVVVVLVLLSWSLVVAITVVVVAVLVLLIVVNNLTKEGLRRLLPWSHHSSHFEELPFCLARFTTQCEPL